MKVYAMKVSGIVPDDKKWYKYLSDKRIEKVERLKKQHNKAQSIGVELLLNFAVKGDIKKRVAWDTDENGKLYLTEDAGLYVNLSHSDNYAICAVHDRPIGVDIQRCGRYNINTAKRFFTAEETEYISGSQDTDGAFFEIWTKKESFVKAVGGGLSIPLNSFSVLSESVCYNGQNYVFKPYKVKEAGYKLYVCYLS